MEFTLTDEQKQKIDAVGKKYNLKLILLHGSYAGGTARRESDLDIAVLGRAPVGAEKVLEMYGELSDIFGDTQERELDVKSLYRADPLFLYQVAKNSRLLYGDITDYNEFRAHAFTNFFDSRDLFRLEKTLAHKFQNYLNKKYAQ